MSSTAPSSVIVGSQEHFPNGDHSWKELENSVRGYFAKGLAKSTTKTYNAGKERYNRFCMQFKVSPLPVTEVKLCGFVSRLANEGLKHQSIKCYLSAVRHLQISFSGRDPFHGINMPRLEYVMKGIKKHQTESQVNRRYRLPITPVILLRLHKAWQSSASQHDTVMIWAASCLAFFGFLRVSEFTVPTDAQYDAGVHLSLSDIGFDDGSHPRVMKVTIKQSKTDPFRKGVTLVLGRTFKLPCPVAAMAAYVVIRGVKPGPLFHFKDGRLLTRKRFVDVILSGLHASGIDASKYNGHSFRIGVATTAASKGFEDSLIKTLGRWESTAYLISVYLYRIENN